MKLKIYMWQKSPFFIALFLTMVFNSCCRSNECQCYKEWGQKVDDCSVKHFGPYPLKGGGAYDYLYFEPGSWWVYQNNLSGETDSIYITNCDTQVYNHTGQSTKWQSVTYTSIRFSMRSEIYNTDYEYYSYANYPDPIPYKYAQSKIRSSSRNNSGAEAWIVFKYPFPDKNASGYFEYYTVLNILGKDYYNVGVFETPSDGTVQLPQKLANKVGHGGNAKYFWAKGYGLIKLESYVYDYTTKLTYLQKWELIKSNLIH